MHVHYHFICNDVKCRAAHSNIINFSTGCVSYTPCRGRQTMENHIHQPHTLANFSTSSCHKSNRIWFLHGLPARICCFSSSQTVGPKERVTNKQQGVWRLVHFPRPACSKKRRGESALNRQQGKRGWIMEKKVNLDGLMHSNSTVRRRVIAKSAISHASVQTTKRVLTAIEIITNLKLHRPIQYGNSQPH